MSPGLRPGKPYSGLGVERSFPRLLDRVTLAIQPKEPGVGQEALGELRAHCVATTVVVICPEWVEIVFTAYRWAGDSQARETGVVTECRM